MQKLFVGLFMIFLWSCKTSIEPYEPVIMAETVQLSETNQPKIKVNIPANGGAVAVPGTVFTLHFAPSDKPTENILEIENMLWDKSPSALRIHGNWFAIQKISATYPKNFPQPERIRLAVNNGMVSDQVLVDSSTHTVSVLINNKGMMAKARTTTHYLDVNIFEAFSLRTSLNAFATEANVVPEASIAYQSNSNPNQPLEAILHQKILAPEADPYTIYMDKLKNGYSVIRTKPYKLANNNQKFETFWQTRENVKMSPEIPYGARIFPAVYKTVLLSYTVKEKTTGKTIRISDFIYFGQNSSLFK